MNEKLYTPKLKLGLLFTVLIIFNFAFHSLSLARQTKMIEIEPNRVFDHVINKKGESRVSIFTGLPIIGSTEYAFGISGRTTFGVLAGFTPFEEAVGIRVRTVLYQKNQLYRVYFCTPVVFYPQTRRVNPDPWYITRPNINFEWIRKSNFRYKIGGSLVASASKHNLFGNPAKSKHPPTLRTAIHAGISMPFKNSGFSFQAELSYVTKGFKKIDDFYGGPPVILITGISYAFR